MAATAWSASGPVARTVTTWPLVAPIPMTLSTLLASAAWSPADSTIDDSNFAAMIASVPAGRACRSPARVTERSELPGIACLLGRAGDGLDVAADGGGDSGGDCSLDERRVRDGERLGQVVVLSEQRAHGQHRAAKVRQNDHAAAGICRGDGVPYFVYAR